MMKGDLTSTPNGVDSGKGVNITQSIDVSKSQNIDQEPQLKLIEADDPYEKSDRIKGILSIIGGISLQLFLGCFFLWGNINIYVLSYFREFNPDMNVSFVFLVDLLLVGFSSVGYNIGTFLLNKLNWSPKLVIFSGGTFALAGFYASSYTTALGPFLSLYCLMYGLGTGTCYIPPMVVAWEYFPERKGLMTGIIIGAYGFGSFFFSLISTQLVNPQHKDPTIESDDGNTYFDKDVADRVPFMIRTLVYIWTVLVIISIVLIQRKPRDRVLAAEARRQAKLSASEQKQYQSADENNDEGLIEFKVLKPEIAGVKYAFYSIRFWQYFGLMTLGCVMWRFFGDTYKFYGEQTTKYHSGISDSLLTWAASIGSGLLNGGSRILMGGLQDKISFKKLLMILLMIWTVLAATMFWLVQYPPLYFIAVLANYFCTGGMYAIFPGSVNNVFGITYAPQIYAIMMMGGFCGALINFLNSTYLLPDTSYEVCFCVACITQILALIVLFFFKEELDVDNLSKYNGIKQMDTVDIVDEDTDNTGGVKEYEGQ